GPETTAPPPPLAETKPAQAQPVAPQGKPAVPAEAAERPKASPLARRLAAQYGIDLTKVRGTGPGGRIVERDIQAYLAGLRPAEAVPSPMAPPEAEYEDLELPRVRQAIARTVVLSKQTIPHFSVTAEADLSRALQLRQQLEEAMGEEGRVTVNDLILKATALALRKHPELRSQILDDRTLRRFARVHLGILVATPNGLVNPVLRDADRLPLLRLSREARRLIEGARSGRLRQEEYTGAVFSVSNLGMYEVANFVAIIPPHQAGILAVGRAQDRPVVREGRVEVRPVMSLTVSADHRITDGVGVAEFLMDLKHLLENPVLLLLQ
ncbi:MAG: dihydrolipoamide acetyltransferase family protein, partial [Armatimonadota bacterium]|nr:dihydrolipoamide acetyltransferase family protein [Armatimonadota bacterium]